MKLRPLSVGEILDAGINVLRHGGGPILAMSAVAFVPALALVSVFGTPNVFSLPNVAGWPAFIVTILALQAGSICAKSFAIVSVGELIYGTNRDWKWRSKQVVRYLPMIATNRALYWLAGAVGYLLLVLPGWWIGLSWSVSQSAILLEGKPVTAAFRRSYRLVHTRFSAVAGWATSMAIMAGVTMAGASALLAFSQLSTTTDDALTILSLYVTTVLLVSLIGTTNALMLIDLKVREEGHDLDIVREDLESAPPRLVPAPAATQPANTVRPLWEPPA